MGNAYQAIYGGGIPPPSVLLRCHSPRPANKYPISNPLDEVPCDWIAEHWSHRVLEKVQQLRVFDPYTGLWHHVPLNPNQTNLTDPSLMDLVSDLEMHAASAAWACLNHLPKHATPSTSQEWIEQLLLGSRISLAMFEFALDYAATDIDLQETILMITPMAHEFLDQALENASGNAPFPLYIAYSLTLERLEVHSRAQKGNPVETLAILPTTIP